MSKIILSSHLAYDGPFLKVRSYRIRDSRNGNLHTYDCMERSNAVAAVVYDPQKKKYLFVEQFRVGAGSELLELVAGVLDYEGEDPVEAVIREIEEETGYKTERSSIRKLSEFYTTPGACSEKMHLYYAEVSERSGDGGGIGDEDIRVVELSREEIKDMAKFTDSKTLIGVLAMELGL